MRTRINNAVFEIGTFSKQLFAAILLYRCTTQSCMHHAHIYFAKVSCQSILVQLLVSILHNCRYAPFTLSQLSAKRSSNSLASGLLWYQEDTSCFELKSLSTLHVICTECPTQTCQRTCICKLGQTEYKTNSANNHVKCWVELLIEGD